MPSRTNFSSSILNEKTAFYQQPSYLESTRKELSQPKALPSSYTCNLEHKVKRIAKAILAIVIFPIGIYKLLHMLGGKLILLPASNPGSLKLPKNYVMTRRQEISLTGEWKYKRITVEVDGYKIDTLIMGKKSTLNNGKWLLASNGNAEFYEQKPFQNDFKHILTELNGNAIIFNYPGVGASSGLPNRKAMAKAYRAILNFLEDQQKGIGAKEIIGYGHSIGGAVQGEALKSHQLKKHIKYVFVKSRTFSSLSTTAAILTGKVLGLLVKILGWNMSSVKSSERLNAVEIILQTARVNTYEELSDPSKVIHDRVIPAEASLAKALLNDKNCLKKNKVFIGIPDTHNQPLSNVTFLANKIKMALAA